MALGGWAAGEGNQVGFAPVIKFPVPMGLGPVPQHPFHPSSAKRRLIRYTVPSTTSRASATWGAGQPASVFSKIRARWLPGLYFYQP